jgi:uncharacterized protein YjiS (DUF1127 family)
MLNEAILESQPAGGQSSKRRFRLITLWNYVQYWREIRRQRRALLGLSDAMLKDIGISRADACREGLKPFWRP